MSQTVRNLSHLEHLEAESIHIMREVVAECERPVMMYSIGKDSAVMLHLARKAFHPARLPFPVLHVDTTWKFREMIAFRDATARKLGLDLIIHINPEGIAKGVGPFTHGSALHTQIMKTEALKQALEAHGFDAAFGGARRDEEKSRAKERIFSFRNAQHRWDPRNQRPELWKVYNARKGKGESIRVFPLSNWTELDVWQYIYQEGIDIVPLYFARERPVVERDGQIIMVDDERMPLKPGETPEMRLVRFRTLGLLSADRRHREFGHHPCRDHPGDAGDHLVGTPGAGHRPRPVGLHGEEEAGGLFLMLHQSPSAAAEVEAYLAQQERKDLLRFITCGSVDDGKSTLIGRLLYESKLLFEDQLAALEADSKRIGTQSGDLDFALLVDGLAAEREQGITIDVAYRAFTTDRRKFIVADTPGHEQYTRNMATGASTAELAVILVDARKGRADPDPAAHLHRLAGRHPPRGARRQQDGPRGLRPGVFRAIEEDYRGFAASLGLDDVTCIPVSALKGDNVVVPGDAMDWYHGAPLLAHLETVEIGEDLAAGSFRLPVQWVNRANHAFRGFAGQIASGTVRPGDPVKVFPSGRTSPCLHRRLRGRPRQGGGRPVITLTLEDEVDVSRGDVICAAARRSRSPTSSRPRSCGWTTSRCWPGGPMC
jgi:sulfate adenylyltransferase small subunit/sulfate adenylyltransferase large subunit